MLIKILTIVTVFLFSTSIAYEIPDENEVLMRTCRISVKIQILPYDQTKQKTGRAIVTATLTDDDGNPYRKERVSFSANAGTFSCQNPDDTSTLSGSTSDSCFSTGDDGIARLYLINVPLNTPIRVTASYLCEDRTVSSNATMSISRNVVKKKRRVSPYRVRP